MCGIVGYIGPRESAPILLDGLKRLEYRGYDSAGLAVLGDGELRLVRAVGNLSQLEGLISKEMPPGSIGIGHTRWATHGRPCEANAHPHTDCSGALAVVHNGIIENFMALREELLAKGHELRSDTDTETIAHLIEEAYDGDPVEAVRAALRRLQGSFAVAVLFRDHPDRLIAARKDSPLILGIGDGEYFVASDIPAVIKHTRNVVILENDEMAIVTPDGWHLATAGGEGVERRPFVVEWDAEAAEKGGYEDFMLKEIFEQPVALRETIRARLLDGQVLLDAESALDSRTVRELEKIFIVACGTSYHAGLVGKQVIEKWARLPVEVDISSEFRYRDLILGPRDLIVAITQSGETADTLAGVCEAQDRGARVLAISNVVGSSVTREADGIIYTHAGPEIGVAATKTLVTQMAALYLFALHLARVRETMAESEIESMLAEVKGLPDMVGRVLEDVEPIAECARRYAGCADFLFLGRGVGLPVALEGALKLKEISYIHAEGYAAGEMKHGPIALIEKDVPVVAVATRGHVYEKIMGNIQEVKARDADVIAVATEGDGDIGRLADHVFWVPKVSELLSAVPSVVPLQLLAYNIAKLRGCNVDQPRNLAKSVTVE